MLQRFNSAYKSMNVILEQDETNGALWLGDYTAAINQAMLKSKGIKTVLTVASGLNIKYPAHPDFIHKQYNILDIESCNIKKIFGDTCEQIHQGLQRGGVFVHCAAGVSRSAATVIAYLMKYKGMSFQEGLNFTRQRRSVVCPNFGFQRQLRQFERELVPQGTQQVDQQTKSKSVARVPQQQLQAPYQQLQAPYQQSMFLQSGLTADKKPVIKRTNLTPAGKPSQARTTGNQFSGNKLFTSAKKN